jgi:hypothetical protein
MDETSSEELPSSASAPAPTTTFHPTDLKDSVAFGLINELEKLNKAKI